MRDKTPSCEITGGPKEARVVPRGSWRLKNLREIDRVLEQQELGPASRIIVDGSGLDEIDTSGSMVLFQFITASGFKIDDIEFEHCQAAHANIFSLVRERLGTPAEIRRRHHANLFLRIGAGTCHFLRRVESIFAFVGHVTIEIFRSLFRPHLIRVREFAVQFELSAIDAIPIVSLVTFLIGVVLAYLFGVQMERYGANIFIVDGVSIAMCREISPILVAIIVAGRSGSAFTAQIGTMKLNEEIDAMETLGLSPVRVLVLPRLFALMIAMPILVFVGDVVGILGGMLIADLHLDITGITFLSRLHVVLTVKSLMVGLFKAPVFAFFIAAIGCRMGLTVENNARSVGLHTTSTVVQSIVSVILLNAAFAVILSELGI